MGFFLLNAALSAINFGFYAAYDNPLNLAVGVFCALGTMFSIAMAVRQ